MKNIGSKIIYALFLSIILVNIPFVLSLFGAGFTTPLASTVVDQALKDSLNDEGKWTVITFSDDTTLTTAGGAGLNNIVEDITPQLGGDLDLNGKNLDFPTTLNIADVLDEDNMVSNSATSLATQQSIKAYTDSIAGGAFDDTGNPIVQNTTTKDVHIGAGAGTLIGKLEVGGDADQPQVVIEANATQTDDVVIIQDSIDTEVFTISKTGVVGTGSWQGSVVDHERGGLEADINAYDGLVGITGGATYNQTGTTTQIIIFDGAGAPTSAALSGDVNMDNTGATTIQANSVALTTDTTGNYATGNAEGGDALVAIAVEITDNELTNEENPLVFVAGAAPAGGDLPLETDGTATYNPSTGNITATGFTGTLTGQADTVATITGLAPDTATTQAAQPNITSLGTLTSLTTAPKLTVNDSATTAPFNLTERSTAPSSPAAGDVYLDDGTNYGSGAPGLRRYTGVGWEDINVEATGSGAFSDAADPVVLNTTSKDVSVGPSHINTSKLSVDGDADTPVLSIQANAIQNDSVVIVEQSAGTEVVNIENDGTILTAVGLDGIGAVNMDYGSADITDHTFTTDGTGTAEIVLPAGSIDSTEILDDTLVNADINSAAAISISKTALIAGTNITLSTDTLNVDDAFISNSGDAITGDLDFNDGVTDSPKATFTPATGTAFSLYVDDASDDLQLEASSASTETIDIINAGSGVMNMTNDGTFSMTNYDVSGTSEFSGAGTKYIKHTGGTAATDKFIFRFSDNEDVMEVHGDATVLFNDSMVERATFKDYAEELTTNANSGITETLDLTSGNAFDITLDNNCTFTFSNPPASGDMGSFTLILRQDATGSRVTTWPASVDWASATAPTLSTGANNVDILTFITVDGGTIWHGMLGSANSS